MKLNEAFERIYVINLTHKPDRKTRLRHQFETTGIVDPDAVRWERAICGDWTPPPAWWGAGNGAWGCLMSHARIAQDAIHDRLDSYCVLEDDVIFRPEAPLMLGAFMKELPDDWGQVYLGGQYLHKEPEVISPWVMRPYNVNRTHAFALSRNAMPRFLQHILHAPDYYSMESDDKGITRLVHNCFHIDHQLGRAHERKDWFTYSPTWWLAGQGAGGSNISGRVNPPLWWHWRDRGFALPFVAVKSPIPREDRKIFRECLHPGYNTVGSSFTDVGLTKELSDEELNHWLHMIAGEAIELWKLPCFQPPDKFPDLAERIERLWKPGVLKPSPELLKSMRNYPFNGHFDFGVPLPSFTTSP